jgi:hypothetical protein
VHKFEILDEAWGKTLETGLMDYIDGLIYSTYDEDEVEAESGAPFCGCDTCYWREVLFFVTPRIIEGFKAGKIQLVGEE